MLHTSHDGEKTGEPCSHWKKLPDGREKRESYMRQALAVERPEAVAAPPVPVLVFDGECRFCAGLVDWLAAHLERRTQLVPWQQGPFPELGLELDEARRCVWWVESDGQRLAAERAVAAALRACEAPWSLAGVLLGAPGMRRLAALGYRAIERIRDRLPGPEPACRTHRARFVGASRARQ